MPNLRSRLSPLALALLVAPALLAGCSGDGGGSHRGEPSPFAGKYQGTATAGDGPERDLLLVVSSAGKVSGKLLSEDGTATFAGTLKNDGSLVGKGKSGAFESVVTGDLQKTPDGIEGALTETFGGESATATVFLTPAPAE